MDWYNINEINQQPVLFPHKITQHLKSTVVDVHENGGILNKGKWGWLTQENQLQIVSLENGHIICMLDFAKVQGYETYEISCIEQVFARYKNEHDDVLLAIILQSTTEHKSCVVIYSVEESDIIISLQLPVLITAAHFVQPAVLCDDLLQYFDGCLAVGSTEGCIYLLNLELRKTKGRMHASRQVKECQIIDANKLETCIRDEKQYALQLITKSETKTVTCILGVEIVQGLVIGFSDGSLSLFDLPLQRVIHNLNAGYELRNVPIVKFCYLLPLDDPTPCFYVWAVFKGLHHMSAVMHSLAYHNYKVDRNRNSLKNLRKMHVCLEVQLENEACSILGFQTVSSISALNEEDGSSLCMISWYNISKTVNKIVLFDLNQWYKEEMPKFINDRGNSRFLAGFVLNTLEKGESAYLDGKTISHFNSLHREEEHFYPNALSFNVKLLQKSGCRTFSWDGVQNRVIHKFRSSNASIFLETDKYYTEILHANLLPQFNDLNGNSNKFTSPLLKKYETMLSFALEYNCCSLIRDCVNCWSDGSFSGNLGIKTGLSLNVIVNWLCKRSDCIESRCKYLCKGLLDSSGGYALDQREQKELSQLIRQLKLLKDVAVDVNNKCKLHNNELLSKNLHIKLKLLQASVFFYPVVLWLFNIGILPVSSLPYASDLSGNFKQLQRFFRERRAYLKECLPNSKNTQIKSKTVHLLFIDAFIQRSSTADEVTSIAGTTFYPPSTLAVMLDVLMLIDLELESKTILLLYFFLDLHATLEHVPACKAVLAQLVKFPTVFQINVNLIKLVQTFWFIDHGNFAQANIDEFLTIIKQNHKKEWLLDLLLQILVAQNESELALRVFQAAPTLIAPALKLKTLLANDLITEAFQIARSERILEVFFEYCIAKGKYAIIRDLALNEAEGGILLRLLKNCKEYCAENLQFVYLLSRSKYIEAVAYMDELSKKKGLQPKQKGVIENSNLVLSAFNTTMAPMAQGLTDIYFRIHNKLKHKEMENNAPVPLSCQLIKQNANTLLGGMYHSSVLSAHFATQYLKEMNKEMLYSDNVPFLRKPQLEAYPMDPERQYQVSIPQAYKGNIKRVLETVEEPALENPQKRRKVAVQIIEDLSLKHGTSAHDLAEQKQKLNESFKKIEENLQQETSKKSSIKTMEDMPRTTKNVYFRERSIERPEEIKYWTTLRNTPTDYTSETLNKQTRNNEEKMEVTTTIDSMLEEEKEEKEELVKESTTTIDSMLEDETEGKKELVQKSITTTIDDDVLEEEVQHEVEVKTNLSSFPQNWNLQARKPLSHVSLDTADSGLYFTGLTSVTTVLTEMKTNDFGPKVCSTTVADVEHRKSEIIYTECTTVIDDTETTIELYLKSSSPEAAEKIKNKETKLQLLETTLDWEDNSISTHNSKEAEHSMSEMEFYNTATEIDVSQLNESTDNKQEDVAMERSVQADEIISLDDDDDNEDDDVEVIENAKTEVFRKSSAAVVVEEEEVISLGDDSDETVSSSDFEDDKNNEDIYSDNDEEEVDISGDTDMMINVEDENSSLETSNEQNESYESESANLDVDMDELVYMPIHKKSEESEEHESETVPFQNENSMPECKIIISNVVSLNHAQAESNELNKTKLESSSSVENKNKEKEIEKKSNLAELNMSSQESVKEIENQNNSGDKNIEKIENKSISSENINENMSSQESIKEIGIENKYHSNKNMISLKEIDNSNEKYNESLKEIGNKSSLSENINDNIVAKESDEEKPISSTQKKLETSISSEKVMSVDQSLTKKVESATESKLTSPIKVKENKGKSNSNDKESERKERSSTQKKLESSEEIMSVDQSLTKKVELESATESKLTSPIKVKEDKEKLNSNEKETAPSTMKEKETKTVEAKSQKPLKSLETIVEIQDTSLSTSNELNESSDISLKMSTPESEEKIIHRRAKSVSKQSVRSKIVDKDSEETLARRRKSKRGISVPPQVMAENKSSLTDDAYTSNRKYRATSLQPREYVDSPTPLKRTKSNRSNVGYLNEYSPNFDSPSQNTRSRIRLLSEDNESDISMVSEAQTNYSSKSRPKSRAGTVLEERSLTPRGRKRRGVSVVPENDETTESRDEEETSKKKSKEDTLEQRRLTRHQLAILEKANAQTAAYASSQKTDDSESLKSTSSKRITRSSLINLSNNPGDDDMMSVSSMASSTKSKRQRGRPKKHLTTITETN